MPDNIKDAPMKKKIAIVFGYGGHQKQMIILSSLLESKFEILAIFTKGDYVKNELKEKYRHVYVKSPRISNEGYLLLFLNTLYCLFQSLRVLIIEKPAAIVSCGPSTAFPVMFAGKITGSKTIFIESWSKVRTKSLTGKLLHPIADLFIVQWEELLPKYRKAIYRGRFIG